MSEKSVSQLVGQLQDLARSSLAKWHVVDRPEELPDQTSGVYVVIDKSHDGHCVEYVGKAIDLRSRWKGHRYRSAVKGDSRFCIAWKGRDEATFRTLKAEEAFWIAALSPRGNIQIPHLESSDVSTPSPGRHGDIARGYVGLFFHEYGQDGRIEHQGRVKCRIEGSTYLVQWMDWVDGQPSTTDIVSMESPDRFKFYLTARELRYAYHVVYLRDPVGFDYQERVIEMLDRASRAETVAARGRTSRRR